MEISCPSGLRPSRSRASRGVCPARSRNAPPRKRPPARLRRKRHRSCPSSDVEKPSRRVLPRDPAEVAIPSCETSRPGRSAPETRQTGEPLHHATDSRRERHGPAPAAPNMAQRTQKKADQPAQSRSPHSTTMTSLSAYPGLISPPPCPRPSRSRRISGRYTPSAQRSAG